MSQARARTTPKNGKNRSVVTRSPTSIAVAVQRALDILARADSLGEIKEIRDQAEALRKYAQDAKAGLELQNRVAELKLRAERRAGEILRSMSLRGGDRKSGTQHARLGLDKLGISKNQSARWQKETLVPEEDFRRFVAAAKAGEMELTTASLLRLAAARSKKKDVTADEAVVSPDAVPESCTRSFDSPLAIIAETRNHCRTLTGVFSPPETDNDDDDPADFPSAQKRFVRQLVGEIKALMVNLEKQLVAAEHE